MKTNIKFQTVLLVGAIWGFFEASMGIYVKGVCGYQMTGSVMTGIAIFFMTLGYSYSKETKSILYMLVLAIILKIFSALIIGKPIFGGGVANPVFAFITEALSLMVIIYLMNEFNSKNIVKNSLFGGLTALIAVNVFPYVGHFTGNVACNTNGYPWSLLYSPVSVSLSMILFPVAIKVGEILAYEINENRINKFKIALVNSLSIVFILLSLLIAK